MRSLRVVTWNVHGFVGTDGRRDVDRIATTLCRLRPDVVGLQEVDCRSTLADGITPLEYLSQRTGLRATAGPTRLERGGFFGNALLTRGPVADVIHADVSVKGREPRGILSAEVQIASHRLRVVVTHFGLRSRERRTQVTTLLDLIDASSELPLVLMGDFNEWRPRAWTMGRLHGALGYTPRVPSFPSRLPLLALDRIWVHPKRALVRIESCREAWARTASDHLPIQALVDLRGGAPADEADAPSSPVAREV